MPCGCHVDISHIYIYIYIYIFIYLYSICMYAHRYSKYVINITIDHLEKKN